MSGRLTLIAINVWPQTLYDLVVNGVKDQEWVKYWKIANQATPDAPAPAEQTKPTEPPPTSSQETTVDSASISSASASSASREPHQSWIAFTGPLSLNYT